MRTIFIALRALVYMTSFVLLWGWLALRVRAFDPQLGGALPSWTIPLGIIATSAGALLVLACAGFFVVRGCGTPAPFDAPPRLVVGGPYEYVRNPMYVGALLVLVGFALYTGSPAMLALAAAAWLLAHLFVVAYEEPTLRRAFGGAYRAYCQAVPRWIPASPGRVKRLDEHRLRPARPGCG